MINNFSVMMDDTRVDTFWLDGLCRWLFPLTFGLFALIFMVVCSNMNEIKDPRPEMEVIQFATTGVGH